MKNGCGDWLVDNLLLLIVGALAIVIFACVPYLSYQSPLVHIPTPTPTPTPVVTYETSSSQNAMVGMIGCVFVCVALLGIGLIWLFARSVRRG